MLKSPDPANQNLSARRGIFLSLSVQLKPENPLR